MSYEYFIRLLTDEYNDVNIGKVGKNLLLREEMNMETLMESAKIMSKGQVTIPKDIREKLNLKEGNQIIFVYDDSKVLMVNPAVYALNVMQEAMKGKAKKVGIRNEEDVVKLVKNVRHKM